ncbi:hypothetical protein EG328_006674 [Venturia inaequalis]|uniref:Methyltransferase domain-containing protein n=1 Tax=Venturia inaequalis TaxID=5025 RepID=A0A8H3UGI6_VENIN|nr:hypothetical protein EG328_006674 [Venturia inaequalis]
MSVEHKRPEGINRDALQSFYFPPPDDLPANARKLLEEYSKISPGEVLPHVVEVREKAWKVFPYPCIGQFKFLGLALNLQPSYTDILSRLKSGQKFLDVGCCVGQEVRQLVLDGAAPENLYASDLHPEFLDIGYDLFKDRETLTSTMFAADTFNTTDSNFVALNSEIDIIWAGSFLHLFSYAATIDVLKQLIKLSNPKFGSLIVGKQMGHIDAGEFVIKGSAPTGNSPCTTTSTQAGSVEGDETTSLFRHDAESFKKMWDDVGGQTGTRWAVWVEQKEYQGQAKGVPKGSLSLSFCVERLS